MTVAFATNNFGKASFHIVVSKTGPQKCRASAMQQLTRWYSCGPKMRFQAATGDYSCRGSRIDCTPRDSLLCLPLWSFLDEQKEKLPNRSFPSRLTRESAKRPAECSVEKLSLCFLAGSWRRNRRSGSSSGGLTRSNSTASPSLCQEVRMAAVERSPLSERPSADPCA